MAWFPLRPRPERPIPGWRRRNGADEGRLRHRAADRWRAKGAAGAYCRHRQQGFGLIELICVLAVTMLIAVWRAGQEVDAARDQLARASGVWLGIVRNGVEQMLGAHYDALSQGGAVTRPDGRPLFADMWAPTIPELVQSGNLPRHFPPQSPLGFDARIAITPASACPGAGCRLDALVISSRAVTVRGSSDEDSMATAQILSALEGKGARVPAHAPRRFVGPNVDLPNPLRSVGTVSAPGTVAAWAGIDRSSAQQFLRVGDTRDPQFRGAVSVAGKILAGALETPGDLTAGTVVSQGAVTAATVSSRGAVMADTVAARGAVTAGTHFRPLAVQALNTWCADAGAIARDSAGATLSCQSGRWRALDGGFGGAYRQSKWTGCRTSGLGVRGNPKTGDCTCPPGYRAMDISSDRGYDHDADLVPFLCIR